MPRWLWITLVVGTLALFWAAGRDPAVAPAVGPGGAAAGAHTTKVASEEVAAVGTGLVHRLCGRGHRRGSGRRCGHNGPGRGWLGRRAHRIARRGHCGGL